MFWGKLGYMLLGELGRGWMLWTGFGGEACLLRGRFWGTLSYGRLWERGGDGEGDLGAVVERKGKGRKKREREKSIVDWMRNCSLFTEGDGLDGMR